MDKYTTENLTLDYGEIKKVITDGVESHSADDIMNATVYSSFIPFFTGMGTNKQKSDEENDKI